MDVKAIRRQNLAHLVKAAHTYEALSERVDVPASYLRQIGGEFSKMGDRVARKIEIAYQKPVGWMDRPIAKNPENPPVRVGNDISTTPNTGAGANVELPDEFRVREAEMPLILMFRKLSPQERGEVLGLVATKFYGEDEAEPEPIPGAIQIKGYERREQANPVGSTAPGSGHRKGAGKTVK